MVCLRWCVDYCVIVGLILSYELRCDTTPMYVNCMVENLWMLIHEVEVVLLLHFSCCFDVFPWLDSMRIIKKWWTKVVILVQFWIHGDVCGYLRKWLHMVYNRVLLVSSSYWQYAYQLSYSIRDWGIFKDLSY